MHIKCGVGRIRRWSLACQKLCLYRSIKNARVTKPARARARGWKEAAGASRKFKVTKRYGGVTRNRNAETNGRAFLFRHTETDIYIYICRGSRAFDAAPSTLPDSLSAQR